MFIYIARRHDENQITRPLLGVRFSQTWPLDGIVSQTHHTVADLGYYFKY